MKGGWFVGDFEPTAYKTPAAEVCFKQHHKGEDWPAHYHAVGTEINLLVRGTMRANGHVLEEGDIFVVDPGEVIAPEFLSDCELVVVKVPSLPGDKYAP
jgi:quercetin dioxygenase-like cupin family protein